ncbi:DNA repair protein RadC [Candidatus Woesearchaeota archaeon]|nr:DNA repair protein RadC [Candidatus Woesearchaeota archaeon]
MFISEMRPDQRPRERLLSSGTKELTDAELLAIILGKGTPQAPVLDIAHHLLSRFGLARLAGLSVAELSSLQGIGKVKAMQLLSVFELQRRIKRGVPDRIQSPKDVYRLCGPKYEHLDKEHFVVLLLDTKHQVLREEVVSVGTLSASIVHPREVFKSAIKESAHGIILLHNHPSGDAEPSEEDRDITDQLVQAGELLGIEIIDHIIIGNGSFHSIKTGKDYRGGKDY